MRRDSLDRVRNGVVAKQRTVSLDKQHPMAHPEPEWLGALAASTIPCETNKGQRFEESSSQSGLLGTGLSMVCAVFKE